MRTTVLSLPTICLLAVSTSGVASAQTPYVSTFSVGNYQPIGGTSHVPTSYAFGFSGWDEGAAEVALPFEFVWFGTGHQTVYVYSNGLVSFQPAPQGGLLRPPGTVPDPTDRLDDFIAPMWADLTGLDGSGQVVGDMRTQVVGNAPFRSFIIQVSDFQRSQNPNSAANFQVWLEEGSGAATVIYGPNNSITSATSAFENNTGLQGANLLDNPTCPGCTACDAGRCGSLNWPTGLSIRLDRPPMAELIGDITGPSGVRPGQQFDATVTVHNIGQGPADGFDVEVRISADEVIDASDPALATLSFPSGLLIATSTTVQVTLTMPQIGTGRFFLGVIVDSGDAVVEASETNNTAYDPRGIVTAPDLVGAISGPLSSGPGEFVDLDVTLESRGTPVTVPVSVAYYLSRDGVFDAGDTLIDTQSITMPDGFLANEVVGIQLPSTAQSSPPTYRLIAVIDPSGAIEETNEANNVAVAGQTLSLSSPDLAVVSLEAPAVLVRQQPFTIAARIANTGGTDARNFTVCALLSRNQLVSLLSDPIIAETTPVTLLAGDETTVRLEPTLGTMTGTGAWYLALAADCDEQVAENSEANNVRATPDPILVRDAAPDFTPVSVATSSAAAGETLAVSVVVANLGPVTGAVHVQVVLSENAGISPTDQVIYETTTPIEVLTEDEATVSAWVELPANLPSGNYFIGAIVDPAGLVDELREDNNIASIGPVPVIGADLTVITRQVPNAVLGVPYTVRMFALGGQVAYDWTIEWESGNAPAGLSFDGVNGEISGVPAVSAEGAHGFTVSVTSGPLTASATLRLLIAPPTLPLTVVSVKLPPALEAESYNTLLVAVGGTPPYSWRLAPDSALPAGILMRPDGTVGGEARGVGAYTFDVIVTDTSATELRAPIAIDVIDPASGVSIRTADVPSGTVGMRYSASFEVEGGTPPYTWRFDGVRIPGLTFESGAPARLTGTATVAGVFPIIVQVTDAQGLLDRNAYVLEIFEPGDLVIVSGDGEAPIPDAELGVPYVAEDGAPVRLVAERRSDGTPPSGLVWSIPLGALPAGLSLDAATGVISGTPMKEEVAAFTVFVRDGSGDNDRRTLAILVGPKGVTPGVTPPGDESCGCATTVATRDAPGRPSASTAALLLLVGAGLLRRRRQ